MAKVTGIGGVFWLSTGDDRALTAWYERCLGLKTEDFGGSILNWTEDQAEDNGMTVWNVGESDSSWFKPSMSRFMINYRIDDMDGMLERLRENDVEIVNGPESHENGRFLWIMDPDGNKVELWEPKIWDDKNKQ